MDSGHKVNILLVDDSRENLVALEAILEGLGENLVKVQSGEEALKYLLGHDCAVILLDVRMPGMDGFETASMIRQREKTRWTPIIFVTAVGTDETHVSQGYSLGAVDYIVKPIVPEILQAKVATFVELFKASEERIQQREQELRSLERLSASSPAYVTGEMYGLKPLRYAAPEVFREMVARYAELLDMTMEQHAYKVQHDISGGLAALADRLGSFRAGPRDVVDIHLAGIKDRSTGTAEKARGYTMEGRLLALELMGHLVDFYRRALSLPDMLEEKGITL